MLSGAVRQSQDAEAAARVAELRQMDLLEPLTPEELYEARQEIGASSGRMAVLAHAREKRRGRPAGAMNKRNDDFVRYLSQFGPDPAVGMMILQGTPIEVLIEMYGGKPLEWIDRQLRAREALLPYFHSKKPVAVDARIVGVRIIEEIGGHQATDAALIEGSIIRVAAGDDLVEDAA